MAESEIIYWIDTKDGRTGHMSRYSWDILGEGGRENLAETSNTDSEQNLIKTSIGEEKIPISIEEIKIPLNDDVIIEQVSQVKPAIVTIKEYPFNLSYAKIKNMLSNNELSQENIDKLSTDSRKSVVKLVKPKLTK